MLESLKQLFARKVEESKSARDRYRDALRQLVDGKTLKAAERLAMEGHIVAAKLTEADVERHVSFLRQLGEFERKEAALLKLDTDPHAREKELSVAAERLEAEIAAAKERYRAVEAARDQAMANLAALDGLRSARERLVGNEAFADIADRATDPAPLPEPTPSRTHGDLKAFRELVESWIAKKPHGVRDFDALIARMRLTVTYPQVVAEYVKDWRAKAAIVTNRGLPYSNRFAAWSSLKKEIDHLKEMASLAGFELPPEPTQRDSAKAPGRPDRLDEEEGTIRAGGVFQGAF